MIITEKEFYYTLKDIAVSLREIAYALKMNNGDIADAEHKVRDTVSSFESDIMKAVNAAEAEEESDIKAIMSEKPDERELKMYRKPIGKPKPPRKRRDVKPKKWSEGPRKTDIPDVTSTAPVSAHVVNPDSDFE